MTIKINNDAIRLRPSAIESFYGCAYQWGKNFLEGVSSIPNSRAAIGTGIHAGVEAGWKESMAKKEKIFNKSAVYDAAIESFQEEGKKGMQYGNNEDANTCEGEILKGVDAFIEDIVPFTSIPKAVETFFKVDIDHSFVSELGGTLDYLGSDTIADVKTSKRKSGPDGHVVQQSIYKYLAEANGHNINHNLIQQVVLTKNPSGAILTLEPDVDYAKRLTNGILDTLDLVAKDVAPIHHILRGNPKHIFCSDKFCGHYNTCPFVRGQEEPQNVIAKVKL